MTEAARTDGVSSVVDSMTGGGTTLFVLLLVLLLWMGGLATVGAPLLWDMRRLAAPRAGNGQDSRGPGHDRAVAVPPGLGGIWRFTRRDSSR